MRVSAVTIATGLLFLQTLRAAEYHVSGTGSDANDGTAASPWRTLQKAADAARAGDTVIARTGVYAKVTLGQSGTAGQPITFANFPGEKPVIDASGITPPTDDTALILIPGRHHITIRGFELRNYKTANRNLLPAGILIAGSCTDITVAGCEIHHIENTGGNTANSGNAFGIAVYGSSITPSTRINIDGNELHHLKTGASESLVINGNVTGFQVTNNRVHDNNNIGIDFIGFEGTCPDAAQDQARDGVCRGNMVWNITSEGNQAYSSGDFSADGIYCDGATRILIEGNVSYDNDIGVELAAERPGKLTSAITLRNNFIYRNRQAGLFLGGYAASGTGGSEGCIVTGNSFFNNDTLEWDNGAVQLRHRTSNCVFTGNIFHGGASGGIVTVPVAASHNVNNRFDYNLHFATSPKWSWNNTAKTTFTAWKTTSGQEAHGLSVNPGFTSDGATPDLHLRLDSPAIDAGDPAFTKASGETDIDSGNRITGQRVDLGADELAPKDSWKKKNFGNGAMNAAISGDLANPAGDGIPNLLKYILGLNPMARSESGLPRLAETVVDGNRYLALEFTLNILAEDVSHVVKLSGDLRQWEPSAIEVSRTIHQDIAEVIARDPYPIDERLQRFIRVRATAP